MSKTTTPLVIAYDFDGTLSPGNMQEYDFIPELGIPDSKMFWQKTRQYTEEQNSDAILAYMYLMLKEAHKADIAISRKNFVDFGKKIKFFAGVESWFKRINSYGNRHGVAVQHFIISSGLREMIEGTTIAKYFTKIYASGFMYDVNGVACWPALAINYTTKTQFLFRINKGSLDAFDDSIINKYMPDEKRPVPFSHMLFIGDGETDIPAMRTVKNQGGHAIAVYPPEQQTAKLKAQQLVIDGRVTITAPADYRADSAIDCAVKAIIRKLAAQHNLLEAGNSSDDLLN